MREKCATLNSKQVTRGCVVARARRTRTTTAASVRRSANGLNRRKTPTSASSPPGGQKHPSKCARAPHLGSDGKGCAAGSHPIPALRHEVASALVEYSAVALKSPCRLHQ